MKTQTIDLFEHKITKRAKFSVLPLFPSLRCRASLALRAAFGRLSPLRSGSVKNLLLLAFFACFAGRLQAQDETVSGNLTVTQSLKAGTTGTAGGLELRTNGILISKGIFNASSQDLLSTDQGAGTRLLWYPGKAAFRAGRVSGTQWNETNAGKNSTAFGENTVSTGSHSTAFGRSNTASGMYSTALGYMTAASAQASAALGQFTAASGLFSIAAGSFTTASGSQSIAAGSDSIASGTLSTAIGEGVRAEAYASLAIGTYNISGGSPYPGLPGDPVFEIGNGTGYWDENQNWVAVRSNALTVYRNGNADFQGVVTCAPGGDIPMFNPVP